MIIPRGRGRLIVTRKGDAERCKGGGEKRAALRGVKKGFGGGHSSARHRFVRSRKDNKWSQ